jgi:hypothetical protein
VDTKKAMGDLVSGFVNDLLGLIRHLLDDEVAAALRSLPVPTPTQSTPVLPQMNHSPEGTAGRPSSARTAPSGTSRRKSATAPPGKRTRVSRSKKRERTKATIAKPRAAVRTASGKSSSHDRKAAKASSMATSKKPTPTAAKASAKTSKEADRATVQVEREANVLEAVRSLHKPKASEIVKQTGLSKKVVYTVLQGLVERGQVAKTEGPHGAVFAVGVSVGAQSTKQEKAGASNVGAKKPSKGKRTRLRPPVTVRESAQSMVA